LTITFFICSYSVLKMGIYDQRDEEQLELVNYFGEIYYQDELVSISPQLKEDWVLHAYLYRYCGISLDDKNEHQYYIISDTEDIPVGYSKIIEKKAYSICDKNK
jgi:hypothetical protein